MDTLDDGRDYNCHLSESDNAKATQGISEDGHTVTEILRPWEHGTLSKGRVHNGKS